MNIDISQISSQVSPIQADGKEKTEWPIQDELVLENWAHGWKFNDQKLWMTAREVAYIGAREGDVLGWETNHPKNSSNWTHPSCDFIFTDHFGQFWCGELKRKKDEAKSDENMSIIEALCQSIYSATMFSRSYSWKRLEHMHIETFSGYWHPVPTDHKFQSRIGESHRSFFDLEYVLLTSKLRPNFAHRLVVLYNYDDLPEIDFSPFADLDLTKIREYILKSVSQSTINKTPAIKRMFDAHLKLLSSMEPLKCLLISTQNLTIAR
jgi:hypothetical protein